MLPKRDISCLDMEDWPEHQYRALSVKMPEYPNQVNDEMILDVAPAENNLDLEEVLYDDGMIKVYLYIDEVEGKEIKLPELPEKRPEIFVNDTYRSQKIYEDFFNSFKRKALLEKLVCNATYLP